MAESSAKRRGIRGWLDERMGLGTLVEFGRQQALKPVPKGMSWAYTLGTLALFYFALQFVTGCLLLMRYAPDAEVAYKTVQDIQTRAEFGWLFRQMHSWGASFVILVLIFHMLKVLWYGSYKRPREFTWFVGVLLLALTLGFCFTGYVLPWNQLAKWATVVGTESIGKMPWIGDSLKELVLGGKTVSGNTLGRFFAIHVFVLPLGLLFLVTAHMILIRWKGITPKLTVREEAELGQDAALEKVGAEPFFPRQVYRELLVMILGFAVLVTFATFFPWHLGEPASKTTPAGIKPEWYFLPVYQGLKYFEPQVIQDVTGIDLGENSIDPALIGIAAINLFALGFFFLPLLDRGKQRKISRRPFFVFFAALSLLAILVLGVLGYLSQRTITFAGKEISFSHLGYPQIKPVAVGIPDKATEGSPGPEEEPGKVEEKDEPDEEPAEGNERPGREIIAEIFARHRPPPPAAEEFVRADGLEPGGTCVGCHRSQARQWRKSVHAATHPPVQCADCHRGIDTSKFMVVAHQGIFEAEPDFRGEPPLDFSNPDDDADGEDAEAEAEAEDKDFEAATIRDVPVRSPEGPEVVDLCGKCHVGVQKMFSPLHMQGVKGVPNSDIDCHNCHSDHRIEPAGLATFDLVEERNIYTKLEDDPRTEPFQKLASSIRLWRTETRPAIEVALARGLGELESHEFPIAIFAKDLDESGMKRTNLENDISWANHSLDPKKVDVAIKAAEDHLQSMKATVVEIEVSMASRWTFAAGVWAVTLVLALLIIRKLRGLDRPLEADDDPRDGETYHDGEPDDDEETHHDKEDFETGAHPLDTETETPMGWMGVDADTEGDADTDIVAPGGADAAPDASTTREEGSRPGRVEAELDAGWMGAVDRPPSVDGDLDASWLSTAEDELDGELVVDSSPDTEAPGDHAEEEPEEATETSFELDHEDDVSSQEIGAIFKRPPGGELAQDESPEEEPPGEELTEELKSKSTDDRPEEAEDGDGPREDEDDK